MLLSVPLFISPAGKETFRVPKELLFRAFWLFLIALVLCRLVVNVRLPGNATSRDPVFWLGGLAVLWLLITASLSGNRAISFRTVGTISMYLLFMVIVYVWSADRSLKVLHLILIPAVVNAVLTLLQASHVWSPFEIEGSPRQQISGLLGNPNDMGMYFVGATIVCIGLIHQSTGKRRVLYTTALCVVIGGLVASQTLTAIGALVGGICVLLLRGRRKLVKVAPVFVLIVVMGLLSYRPVTERLVDAAAWIEGGDYDRVFSGRGPAFLAAMEMARDHPFFGVGPGMFHWHYYEYALRVEDRHPSLVGSSMNRGVNFGEVHNDHLQILAETGVVGYALFLLAVALILIRSVRADPAQGDERMRFSQYIALPFVVSMVLLMTAQFPLNLVASATLFISVSALILRWSAARHA